MPVLYDSPNLQAARSMLEDLGIADDSNHVAIAYGSAVRSGSETSDLDLLIISLDQPDTAWRNRVIEAVIKFHERSGRAIDTEVPYTNKLFYTPQEIADSLALKMFTGSGKFDVPTLEAMAEGNPYFSSPEMKLRLALNALTSTHILLAGNKSLYQDLCGDAPVALVALATNLHGLRTPHVALDYTTALALLTHSGTASYKDFLGYQANDEFFTQLLRQAFPE